MTRWMLPTLKVEVLSILDLQLIKTTITRQMLDNLYLTNNARVVAVEGQVNLDDLLTSTALSSSYANNATSASYAVTASHVTTAPAPIQIYGTKYSGSLGTPNTLFSFIAGSDVTGAASTSSITISELNSKQLGTSAFVTANVSGSGGTNNAIVINSLAGGILTFQTQQPSTTFYYTVFYT